MLPPNLTPPADSALDSLTAVSHSPRPEKDIVALISSLQDQEISPIAQTEATPYQVGDAAPFWYKDTATDKNLQIQADLLYRSDQLNLWFQEGINAKPADVAAAAQRIETEILPTNRAFFGTEWQPGVDGDNRINVLHLKDLGNVGVAYFWSGDELPTAVNPYSNQRELLYVSLKDARLGSDDYFQAIAHELQHLIQWHVDKNEDSWLNEGLGELAGHVNGFNINRVSDYVNNTDNQLTALSHDPNEVAADYANSFYFSAYLLDRFGEETTRALVQHAESGTEGITAVLATLNPPLTFEDTFADWTAASYLHSHGLGEGIYSYQTIALDEIKPQKVGSGATHSDTVHQFGADYFTISGDEPVTVIFTGTQQIPLIDATPFSGDYFYASLPGDESAYSLTRTFDLSGLDSATLQFQTWYDIEAGWDYAYVMVSGDNGRSWHILPATSSTLDNPQGNSLGPAFTGKSGGGDSPVWQQETVDLSAYAGKPILLRFQTITDGAVNEAGLLLDDITIPELNFSDNAEQANGWDEQGIVRTTNTLPASFIVQRILINKAGTQVERLPLDENNQGEWLFPLDKDASEVILIISGSTPITREISPYLLSVEAAAKN
ncbi:MAG: immune inhibitor A [Anaerolineae bacterium]|nr:immune inhibitor A [Anaerolineae bacterium]